MRRRIKKFFEMMVTPEVKKELGLDKFQIPTSDVRYFFDEKMIEEVYDKHYFQVIVYKLANRGHLLIIPMRVDWKGEEFDIFMVLTSDDEVYYGSKTGEQGVQDLRMAMGEYFEDFDELTNQILNDHVPEDYWDVRAMQN